MRRLSSVFLGALLLTGSLVTLVASGVTAQEEAVDGGLVAASLPDAAPLASPQEFSFVELVNVDRVRNGLPPVILDPALLTIARQRAAAQLNDQPLNHYDAQGQLAFVGLLSAASVSYSLAGENLARSATAGTALVERVESAFMQSPTHRRNILEPSFNRLAIGMAADATGRVTFAQIFRAEL